MTQRYVSYRRVSTEAQEKSGLGLESQSAIIKHFYPTCEKDFCDVKSGGTIDRPQLQAAIKYCKETGAILVVAKADRLSRNVRHALEIYDDLQTNIRFCDIPGDPPERFILTIHWAISERERDLIRIRINAAFKIKRERGDPFGTQIAVNKDGKPMDRDRLKKHNAAIRGQSKTENALTNPVVIRAMSYARSLRDKDMTYEQIAAMLNHNDFPTSTGGKWAAGTVCRMMRKFDKNKIDEAIKNIEATHEMQGLS